MLLRCTIFKCMRCVCIHNLRLELRLLKLFNFSCLTFALDYRKQNRLLKLKIRFAVSLNNNMPDTLAIAL